MSQWIRRTTRWAIYIRDGACLDGARCGWCDRLTHEPTLDHLTPRTLGGSHHPTNLVTSCRTCNLGRKSQDWETLADSGNADIPTFQRLDRLRLTELTQAHADEGVALAARAGWFRGHDGLFDHTDDTPYEAWA